MYKLILPLFFSCFLLLSCNAKGTDSDKPHKTKKIDESIYYKIDESIIREVENNINDSISDGMLELKMYVDDVLLNDEPEKGGLFVSATWNGDTISILGFHGFAVSLGFNLDLYKNKYDLSFMTHVDAPVLKYSKYDEPQHTLYVPCSYTSCTLASKPTYKKEETIYGVVELKSKDFWEDSSTGMHKYRVELKAYFIAKELTF